VVAIEARRFEDEIAQVLERSADREVVEAVAVEVPGGQRRAEAVAGLALVGDVVAEVAPGSLSCVSNRLPPPPATTAGETPAEDPRMTFTAPASTMSRSSSVGTPIARSSFIPPRALGCPDRGAP
jgi:hypothetical protein